MKKKYLATIITLIFVAIAFELIIILSPMGIHPSTENAIQGGGIFVALLASIVALSTTDPKRKIVNVKIENSIDKGTIAQYNTNELNDELKGFYQNCGDPVKSYKIQFTMTNNSGYTLVRPVVSFRLPIEKQHPHRDEKNSIFTKRTFHSNLFSELRYFLFADTIILANSNLPYWNDHDTLTFWIRMAVDDNKNSEPFDADISINCENAEGITKKIKIKPKELMN